MVNIATYRSQHIFLTWHTNNRPIKKAAVQKTVRSKIGRLPLHATAGSSSMIAENDPCTEENYKRKQTDSNTRVHDNW